MQLALNNVIHRESSLAELFCAILSNLSRHETTVDKVIDVIEGRSDYIARLVTCFTGINYNKKGCKLDYLGPTFSNISQHSKGRALICNRELGFFQRILPFTHFKDSVLRRGGAIGEGDFLCLEGLFC